MGDQSGPEVAAAVVTLAAQIAEVEREIRMRHKVYPGQVRQGRMTPREAEKKLAVMEAVLTTLRDLEGKGGDDDIRGS
jgi:hypothetical protein